MRDLRVRSQLLDIIRGLNYLHSQDVVHGNLKGVGELRKMCFITSLMIWIVEHPH